MSGKLLIVALAALVGAALGWWLSDMGFLSLPVPAGEAPLPHVIPKLPGGTALSLAMVHDVLHERYVRHGPAYYRERNRLIQDELKRPEVAALRRLNLQNDLAVGQYSLGEFAAGVATLQEKRAAQKEVERAWLADPARPKSPGESAVRAEPTPERMELYRTYSNLGTFLILDSLREGLAANAASRQRLAEGTELIREAIRLYPESHFGREKWQLVILEFLLAVSAKPQLLLEFDMIGDRLDASPVAFEQACRPGWIERWRRVRQPDEVVRQLRGDVAEASIALLRPELRSFIPPVGAEAGWTEAVKSVHEKPAPFDEPALAIVGMWMIGGGPNPFFALALGEMMFRVGQLELAWQAYARAADMAKGVWPDPAISKGFADHCWRRCGWIEGALLLPSLRGRNMRMEFTKRYDDGLARGRAYQKAYHDFEAARLAAGVKLDAPAFYAPFVAQHGEIATPVGAYDTLRFAVEPGIAERWPAVLFCAGLAALGVGMLPVRRKAPKASA